MKLDPANHKTVLDIQQEDSHGRVDAMDVDDEADATIVPLPTSGGIQHLREKLHAKMSSFRHGGAAKRPWRSDHGEEQAEAEAEVEVEVEASSKDELLEERRRQRGLLRERRRKETKEKIRKQDEARGKKGKGRERDTGKQTQAKVSSWQGVHSDMSSH